MKWPSGIVHAFKAADRCHSRCAHLAPHPHSNTEYGLSLKKASPFWQVRKNAIEMGISLIVDDMSVTYT